jgi:adenine/guanine phosphoribosyltransferase-like PRPP-binding protein
VSRKAPRFSWIHCFPDVEIGTDEKRVLSHSSYVAAKSGDVISAKALVLELVTDAFVARLRAQFEKVCFPTLLAVHAEEAFGRNQIATALAAHLADRLELPVENRVVQENVVNHTKSNGFARLARQALFVGKIEAGKLYLLVDDFVGQGGTLANLRGHVLEAGGSVVGATVLTGKPHSAKIQLEDAMLQELRAKHGYELERWWKSHFGFGFECLTQSEARYLVKTADAHKIRSEILAAG